MTFKKIGLGLVTMAAAFGLMACGDDSSASSAPEAPAVSSSSEELLPASSSSFDPENFDFEEFKKNLPDDCNTLEDSVLVSLCHLYKLDSMIQKPGITLDPIYNKCNVIEDPEDREKCINESTLELINPFRACDEIEDPEEQERCIADILNSLTIFPGLMDSLITLQPSDPNNNF